MQKAALPFGAIVFVLTGIVWAGSASSHPDHGGSGPAPKAPVSVTQGNFYPMGEEGAVVFGSAKLVRYDESSELLVRR
ncbi:MAG: hypothetical protein ACRDZ3_22335 [Acidimicrobiia bacterium]